MQRAGLTKLSSDASFDDEFPSSSSPPTASNIALLPAAPVMTEYRVCMSSPVLAPSERASAAVARWIVASFGVREERDQRLRIDAKRSKARTMDETSSSLASSERS